MAISSIRNLSGAELFHFPLSLIAVAFPTQYGGYYGYYRGYQILNLALFAGWISLAKRANIIAAVFGAAAAVAAARVFFVPEYMYDYESGMADKIEHLGLGYWLWSASMACALIAAIIRLSMRKPGFYEREMTRKWIAVGPLLPTAPDVRR